MTQFFATPISKSLGTNDAWLDIDLSGDIPANATGAIIRVHNTHTAWQKFGLRENGSTDDRYGEMEALSQGYHIIGVDSNRKIEGKIENTVVDFWLVGYTEADATLFTNGIDKSISTWDTWTDIDLSANLPVGSVAAIFQIKNEDSQPKKWALRKKGGADERYEDLCEDRCNTFIVGVDSSRKCQGKIENTLAKFYLMGYLTAGTAETNGIDRSLGTVDTFTDITESNAPNGATGAWVHYYTSQMTQKYAARKNGSSINIYLRPDARNTMLMVPIDSNKKWEGKIEDLANDWFTLGYFSAGYTEITKTSSIGMQTVAQETKTSSIGMQTVAQETKTSSICLSIATNKTKTSSIGLNINHEGTNVSTIGVSISKEGIKTSSVGISISEVGVETKASSIGLTILEVSPYEDFTTFTEVDIGADRIQKTANHIDHVAYRNETTYVYKDYNVGHFNNFEHRIKLKTPIFVDMYSTTGVWVLANAIGSIEELRNASENFLYIMLYRAINGMYIHLREVYNGVTYNSDFYETPHLNWRYIKISKSGTSLIAWVYSDAEYSTLIDTCNLTLHVQDNYRYLYPASSINNNNIPCFTIDTENFDLRLNPEKTKASSIGLSIIASEEKTKASSIGLSILGEKTKASSIGLSITEFGDKTKASSIGLSILGEKTKASSIGLYISEGTRFKASSIGLSIFGIMPILKKGLFYGKLGDTILEAIEPESFRISEEINRIPSYEFEVANSEVNRAAIAANPTALLKIYWQHHGIENHIFTGIINADGIEYVSLTNIRITGFSSYVKLGWPLFKHLDSEDAESVNKAFDFHGAYTDYTTEANNPTINDTLVTFGGENHCFYIGEANPFWGLQIKYSTPGVANNAVIAIEFSKGSGTWGVLNALDETNAFTEDAGTYDFIIAHPPSDWERNTVDGVSKYWIRWRVISGAYTTSPKLDQVHTVNVDIYRVFYLATSARAILLDTLEGTEYSMDTIDTCPEDEINLFAEYESPLRVIAAIPAALTWTDGDGSKKAYQWWIDEAKKVHIKKKRGTSHPDDITGDLTIFNNLLDYFNVSNRLIGFAKRDGLSQIRAIVENTASQTTHALRELAVPKTDVGKYITLKESLEKDIAISKDPMQRLKGSVTTEFWGLRGYEVGDTITLHQGEWVVEEGEFQIVKVDRGPVLTQLNLGVSREHLEGLKSNLKRSFDLNNIQMHGSTSLLTAGPETMNYHRVSASEVYSAKLKIEIPSTAKKTHKVLLSWTLGPYRASVGDTTGEGGGQSSGYVSAGGAHGSGYVGAGGAFTPGVGLDGDFIPAMLGKAHTHSLEDTIYIAFTQRSMFEVWSGTVQGGSHRHSGGGSGYPNSTAYAVTGLNIGTPCTSGWCITSHYGSTFATGSHYHQNSDTGYTTPGMYLSGSSNMNYVVNIDPIALIVESENESPAHIHDGVPEDPHLHAGIPEPAHYDHIYPALLAHIDHMYPAIVPFTLAMLFRIFEITGGTTLELLVNEEKVGEYDGPQTDIRIDGYLTTGSNTIEIQPIEAEVGKKGSATISGSGIMFLEPKRF